LNWLKYIPVLWRSKAFIEQGVREGTKMTDGKAGWKTSEFWMNVVAQAGILWTTIEGFVPPKYAVIISVAGTAIYTIARTIAKAVSEIQAAKAVSTTMTTTAPVTTVSTPAQGEIK
jgi:hypothetical protein